MSTKWWTLGSAIVAMAALLALGAPGQALAQCPFGTDTPTECVVSNTVQTSGAHVFGKTLHITSTGKIEIVPEAKDAVIEDMSLLGGRLVPAAADGEPGRFLEVDVRQDLLLGELDRLLPIAGRELLVALDRRHHVGGDLPDELLRAGVLSERRHSQNCPSNDDL